MELTNEDIANVVLADLDGVPPVLHEVTEAATAEARAFFETRNESINSYLFPCLVRYFAMIMLRLPRYSQAGYSLVGLSNNGLFIIYQKNGKAYRIRILKADEDGDLPLHNLSEVKRQFYANLNPYLPGIEWGVDPEAPPPSGLNLIALWDVNDAYGFTRIQLVCPDGDSGQVYFVGNIPHAATNIRGDEAFDETPEELEDIDTNFPRTADGDDPDD